MSSNREQFTTEIFVNNEQAQDATAKLTAKLEKQTQTYERLRHLSPSILVHLKPSFHNILLINRFKSNFN